MNDNLLKVLACPTCKHPVSRDSDSQLSCSRCGAQYPVIGGVPIMLTAESRTRITAALNTPSGRAMQHKYKSTRVRKGNLWNIVKRILRPPPPTWHIGRIEQVSGRAHRKVQHVWDGEMIVNIGGGPERHHPKELNLNIGLFPDVEIVGDAHELPFLENSLDSAISGAVLEHLEDPRKAVEEMFRVLKPGGWLYAEVPFLQHFHAVPGDYQRYTLMGLDVLFDEFEKVESGICVGPSSALAPFLLDYLTLLLPWGRSRMMRVLVGWLVWPIKYLDLFIVDRPRAANIASALYFCGRKAIG